MLIHSLFSRVCRLTAPDRQHRSQHLHGSCLSRSKRKNILFQAVSVLQSGGEEKESLEQVLLERLLSNCLAACRRDQVEGHQSLGTQDTQRPTQDTLPAPRLWQLGPLKGWWWDEVPLCGLEANRRDPTARAQPGTRHRPWRVVCHLLCSQRTQTWGSDNTGCLIQTQCFSGGTSHHHHVTRKWSASHRTVSSGTGRSTLRATSPWSICSVARTRRKHSPHYMCHLTMSIEASECPG